MSLLYQVSSSLCFVISCLHTLCLRRFVAGHELWEGRIFDSSGYLQRIHHVEVLGLAHGFENCPERLPALVFVDVASGVDVVEADGAKPGIELRGLLRVWLTVFFLIFRLQGMRLVP